MKIYFAGSIKGGRELVGTYFKIVEFLKGFGEVSTEHIAEKSLSSYGEKLDPKAVFERDAKWIRESDVVVAEVTVPSLGVGWEIAYAQSLGKKVICLYNTTGKKALSSMIAGNSGLEIIKYKNIEEALAKLAKLISN